MRWSIATALMGRLALAFVAFYSFGPFTFAQQGTALSIRAALSSRKFAELMPIALSPEGKWVAYTLQDNQRQRSVDAATYARNGVPSWATGTDIYVLNV